MLNFETDVRLNTNANAAEIAARLSSLVAAPYTLARKERRRPLRGRVSPQGGFLRWPLYTYRISSPRNLRYTLQESDGRAVLTGKFVIWQPLRIVALTWLACGLTLRTWILAHDLLHHAGWNAVGKDLLIMPAACCMALGYLAGAVFAGKKRDADLIRVLRTILASEAGAAIVTDLLTQRPTRETSFTDPPLSWSPQANPQRLQPSSENVRRR